MRLATTYNTGKTQLPKMIPGKKRDSRIVCPSPPILLPSPPLCLPSLPPYFFFYHQAWITWNFWTLSMTVSLVSKKRSSPIHIFTLSLFIPSHLLSPLFSHLSPPLSLPFVYLLLTSHKYADNMLAKLRQQSIIPFTRRTLPNLDDNSNTATQPTNNNSNDINNTNNTNDINNTSDTNNTINLDVHEENDTNNCF